MSKKILCTANRNQTIDRVPHSHLNILENDFPFFSLFLELHMVIILSKHNVDNSFFKMNYLKTFKGFFLFLNLIL